MINLKAHNLFPPSSALQDGGSPYLEGYTQARRLAGKGRSEGRLPNNSNTQNPQETFKGRYISSTASSSAPWVVTKTLKQAIDILRRMRLIVTSMTY